MAEKKLSFQQSMNRLDQIVNLLGNPNVELEEAMALFKEGLELSRTCQKQLDFFEHEMNQLIEKDGLETHDQN
ncbi:MAG: exodeoxyribonuclease VII small subunit [Allobaculum sp.]